MRNVNRIHGFKIMVYSGDTIQYNHKTTKQTNKQTKQEEEEEEEEQQQQQKQQ